LEPKKLIKCPKKGLEPKRTSWVQYGVILATTSGGRICIKIGLCIRKQGHFNLKTFGVHGGVMQNHRNIVEPVARLITSIYLAALAAKSSGEKLNLDYVILEGIVQQIKTCFQAVRLELKAPQKRGLNAEKAVEKILEHLDLKIMKAGSNSSEPAVFAEKFTSWLHAAIALTFENSTKILRWLKSFPIDHKLGDQAEAAATSRFLKKSKSESQKAVRIEVIVRNEKSRSVKELTQVDSRDERSLMNDSASSVEKTWVGMFRSKFSEKSADAINKIIVRNREQYRYEQFIALVEYGLERRSAISRMAWLAILTKAIIKDLEKDGHLSENDAEYARNVLGFKGDLPVDLLQPILPLGATGCF
jgi:hypothetical protein